MPYYTALATLLAIALYFFFTAQVAVARGKYGVKHPAITGHPAFERTFRVQMNTLEWLPIFLGPLWLCALTLSDRGAAALGLVWIVGRFAYFMGYSKAVEKRVPGFFIQAIACLLLFVGAAYGVVARLLPGS